MTRSPVQADDKVDVADARAQCLHVGGQVWTSRLLRGLNDDDDAEVSVIKKMVEQDNDRGREKKRMSCSVRRNLIRCVWMNE